MALFSRFYLIAAYLSLVASQQCQTNTLTAATPASITTGVGLQSYSYCSGKLIVVVCLMLLGHIDSDQARHILQTRDITRLSTSTTPTLRTKALLSLCCHCHIGVRSAMVSCGNTGEHSHQSTLMASLPCSISHTFPLTPTRHMYKCSTSQSKRQAQQYPR